MDFVQENYETIGTALQSRSPIEFVVAVEATPYHGTTVKVPDSWEKCVPAGSPETYSYILSKATLSPNGIVAAISLIVERDGGTIHYKSAGSNKVAMRVTWPPGA